MVLEPDFHLGGAEAEEAGHVLALRRTQILLRLEAALQLPRLLLAEQNAAFALLVAMGDIRLAIVDLTMDSWRPCRSLLSRIELATLNVSTAL